MASVSARMHATHDIHQHEEPQLGGEAPALPDSRGETASIGKPGANGGRLWREGGKVMYEDGTGEPAQAVRVVWSRPLSGRGGPVSVMQAGKKKEVAFFSSPDALPEESRAIALEELEAGAVLPRITAIHRVKPRFGNYYWDVETTMGRRTFLLSSPENNSMRPLPDVIVVKDVSGNCYEISPVSGLDPTSRKELDRVL